MQKALYLEVKRNALKRETLGEYMTDTEFDWLVINVAYLITVLAFSLKDILLIRCIIITANALQVIYQFGLNGNNYTIGGWNLCFLAINLFQVIKLLRDKRPIALPNVIADLHSGVFEDLTQREFLYFWHLGKQGKLSNTYIIKEGEKQNSLFLVLSGESFVKRDNTLIAKLKRGEFVGEISFITKEPASADVYAESEVNFIEWDQNKLRKLKTVNPTFWAKLNNILGKDLAKKITHNSIVKTESSN